MTEATTEPETGSETTETDATSAVEQPDSAAQDAETSTAPEDRRDANRDAKTRTKLRATEQERDALRGALTPHIKAAVEAAVGDRLADGSSLWLLPELDPLSLVAEDYSLDAEKTSEAVERLLTHAPSLGRRFGGSADGGIRGSEPKKDSKWSELMKGA